jgi:hypothetical protein
VNNETNRDTTGRCPDSRLERFNCAFPAVSVCRRQKTAQKLFTDNCELPAVSLGDFQKILSPPCWSFCPSSALRNVSQNPALQHVPRLEDGQKSGAQVHYFLSIALKQASGVDAVNLALYSAWERVGISPTSLVSSETELSAHFL